MVVWELAAAAGRWSPGAGWLARSVAAVKSLDRLDRLRHHVADNRCLSLGVPGSRGDREESGPCGLCLTLTPSLTLCDEAPLTSPGPEHT